ncbi:4Fe-4S dicluster domain-containing protein [Candidatus Xianfuyuplasma coldseepsis]|uniref:4Fe-4S dicluster domain-containing protein n=1 Tax=Candidatus Xianfuyuplasma coldseepsis TaxID=2782163 RepID=A0A7L7KP83_9MOLU|nr:4Fe-4S dicluster domain-containing protein [Xianfuyuplasma coldseepsis]QMS84467.1 4Fe-4S dicluster domain-containing protein [Xianfuyuplasma coldseepsis]
MITENRIYLTPDKVFLPLTDKTSKIAVPQVEIGDKVLVGQVVAHKYNGKQQTPVIATVSGEVTGFEQRLDRFNKIVDHIVIENDKLNQSIDLTKLDGDVAPALIRERLQACGIHQVTVDGIYTDITFERPLKHILINAVYINEPFVSTDYDFIKQNAEAIADGIDLLKVAAHAEKATLIVDKYMDYDTLEALGKATVDKGIDVAEINTKKIKGWDYHIAKKLVGEVLSIDLIDNQILYTSTVAAKMVYDAVREGKPATNRHLAITGDAFLINAMYDVKIGTPFTEIVDDLGGYHDETEELNCHIGSFLSGEQVDNDSFTITASIDNINVSGFREEVEDVCIKCGECNDICPAGILPQNIMDAELRAVNSRIVELNTDRCVECGLCSYVCPSKINVLEWVRRAKRRVG